MKKFTTITLFAELCSTMGVKEADYEIKPDATAKVNEAICRERLLLQSKIAYGGKLPDITDTGEWKYTPVHRIDKDEAAPFGFRLSYFDYDCDRDFSYLGARPPFPDSATAIHSGRQFPDEHAQWLYWLNRSYQE